MPVVCSGVCVIERVASGAWQVAVWEQCRQGGQYDSRMLSLAHGLLEKTADEYIERLSLDWRDNPSASIWLPLRSTAAKLGMATWALSMVYAGRGALEQLIFFLMRGPLFNLFGLVGTADLELARKLLSFKNLDCTLSDFFVVCSSASTHPRRFALWSAEQVWLAWQLC